MELGKDIWLPISWSNLYNFMLIVVLTSQAFKKGLTRICTSTQNGWLRTAQKMTFSIKDFLSKCDQIRRTFTEEIPNGKLHFLCSDANSEIV